MIPGAAPESLVAGTSMTYLSEILRNVVIGMSRHSKSSRRATFGSASAPLKNAEFFTYSIGVAPAM